MPRKAIVPDDIAYSAAIHACRLCRQHATEQVLIQRLQAKRLSEARPLSFSFEISITALILVESFTGQEHLFAGIAVRRYDVGVTACLTACDGGDLNKEYAKASPGFICVPHGGGTRGARCIDWIFLSNHCTVRTNRAKV